MPSSSASANIKMLAEAGLLSPTELTSEDHNVIGQLTNDEVAVLIEVARRLYPDDHSIVRIGGLLTGNVRMCLPL